jgi:hypothetical protein
VIVSLGRCITTQSGVFVGEMFVFPWGDVVSLRKWWCHLRDMCLFSQGNVCASLRRCVRLPDKMWLSSWGNNGVSLRRCDCFPREDEVIHVILREMYSWNSLPGVHSYLGYVLGTSTNGFLSSFCHFDLKMYCFVAKWFHEDQVRWEVCGGLSNAWHMVYFYESPRGNG